jgi:hypothetical protein
MRGTLKERLYRLRKNSALYLGTTLVGPHSLKKIPGFWPLPVLPSPEFFRSLFSP